MREKRFIWYSVLLIMLALVAFPAAAQEQGFYVDRIGPRRCRCLPRHAVLWRNPAHDSCSFHRGHPYHHGDASRVHDVHPDLSEPGNRSRRVPVTIELVPAGPSGSLSVTSNPSGGVVTIDGGDPRVDSCDLHQPARRLPHPVRVLPGISDLFCGLYS